MPRWTTQPYRSSDNAERAFGGRIIRILLAEDDLEIAKYVARELTAVGHTVVTAATGDAAFDIAECRAFDAMILDRMMPGMDGLEVLRRLRDADVHTPILVLSAKGGIADRVDGLNAGADDYLVKPFAMTELMARLTALARRPPISDVVTRRTVGDIVLDLVRRDVTRADRPVLLQPREFELLEMLMRHAGQIVTRTMILEDVWGFHFDPKTNIIESHLSRTRAKLRKGFADDPIETVRGAGYRMRVDG